MKNPLCQSLLLFFSLLILAVSLASLKAEDPSPASTGSLPPSIKKPGTTVVVTLSGSPKVFENGDKEGKLLQKGDQIAVGAALVLENGSALDIALSNGVVIQLKDETRFVVEEFSQTFDTISNKKTAANKEDEAFLASIDESANKADTKSVLKASQAKLNLEYGTMFGKVEKLNAASELDILTPVGVARIRGTTFRISVSRSAAANQGTGITGRKSDAQSSDDGKVRVAIDVSEGRIVFSDSTGTKSVQIQTGYSTTIETKVNSNGEVKINNVSTRPLTVERTQLLAETTKNIESQRDDMIVANPELQAAIKPEQPAESQTNNGDTTAQTGIGQVPAPQQNPVPPPPPTPTPASTATPASTPTVTPTSTPPTPTPTPTVTPTPNPSNP
jgi:hypothetical protein